MFFDGLRHFRTRSQRVDIRSLKPFDLPHSREFQRLNVEAQRGFPNFVKPPYLTWHFSCWPDLGAHFADASTEEDGERLRTNWHKANNGFIQSVVGDDAAQLIEAYQAGRERAQDTLRGNVRTYEGLPFNSALLFRVEFHEEHVSYTFVLPVIDPCSEANRPDEFGFDPRHKVHPAFHGNPHTETDPLVNALIKKTWDETLRQENETTDEFRERGAVAWDHFYNDVWEIAFRDAPPNFSAKKNPTVPPGRVFANARGMCLSRDWLVNAYGAAEFAAHEKRKEQGLEQFVPTDLEKLPSVMPREELEKTMGFIDGKLLGEDPPHTPRRWNRISAGRVLVRNQALRHALHWPGGIAPDALSEEPHFHRRTIANLLLDGRALFASSFAAPATKSRREGGPNGLLNSANDTAVRFCVFFCSDTDAGSQELLERRLDRVMLRLNSLATLRLIALKSLDGLLDVDVKLDYIEREIVETGMNPAKAGTEQQNRIQRLYNRLANLSSHTTGSVVYRTARSQMYSDQFKRIVANQYPNPIEHRIEGWEPYDEFVGRRLYNQFDNIKRIGDRIEYVRERLDRIVELTQLDRTVRLTKLAVWVTAIAALIALVSLPSAIRSLFPVFF